MRPSLVPRRGLEPPRFYPLVPETSASTNSATWAGASAAIALEGREDYGSPAAMSTPRGGAGYAAQMKKSKGPSGRGPARKPGGKTAAASSRLPPWMPPPASAPGTKRPRSYDPFGRDAPAPRQAGATPPADPFASREVRRYEHPIVSREAILAHLRAAPGPMTAEDLAAAFGLPSGRPGPAALDDQQQHPRGERQQHRGDDQRHRRGGVHAGPRPPAAGSCTVRVARGAASDAGSSAGCASTRSLPFT